LIETGADDAARTMRNYILQFNIKSNPVTRIRFQLRQILPHGRAVIAFAFKPHGLSAGKKNLLVKVYSCIVIRIKRTIPGSPLTGQLAVDDNVAVIGASGNEVSECTGIQCF